MKNYVQYHNAFKEGPLQRRPDGQFQNFAKKSINHLMNHRVWLISGHGKSSPKHYQLEYVFRVEEVVPGPRNIAIGSAGLRYEPPIVLNGLPWFSEFLALQQNFSLGVREVDDEALEQLEQLSRKAESRSTR